MKMSEQLGFYIDSSLCSGCKACQVACKDKKDLEVGRLFRRVSEVRGGGFKADEKGAYANNVFAYTLSIACNHCADPICVKKCPAGAMYKRRQDGIVLIDDKKCIGCGTCARLCPYGAPQMNPETRKMSKCDFCQDLRERGEDPACVSACPLHAIEYGAIDKLRAQYGSVCDVNGLPSSRITRPNLVICPHTGAV